MLKRSTQIAAICVAALWGTAPVAAADPDPGPPVDPAVAVAGSSPVNDPPAPPDGAAAVPPGSTSYLKTADGWELSVSAANETLLPALPLTTALSSREYLVGGTFNGSVAGSGRTTLTGGILEVGYRIGCGITADNVDLDATANINPNMSFANGMDSGFSGVSGSVRVTLKAGVVNVIQVAKKSFNGTVARINIADVRIKIDLCAGQSFIQSYATLTSSTTDTEDISTYLGTVKVL